MSKVKLYWQVYVSTYLVLIRIVYDTYSTNQMNMVQVAFESYFARIFCYYFYHCIMIVCNGHTHGSSNVVEKASIQRQYRRWTSLPVVGYQGLHYSQESQNILWWGHTDILEHLQYCPGQLCHGCYTVSGWTFVSCSSKDTDSNTKFTDWVVELLLIPRIL